MARSSDTIGARAAGGVGVGLGATLVYGGVRHDDVPTGVTIAAVGVALVAVGVGLYRERSLQVAVAMFGLAVAGTVAGFVVGGGLGVAAGIGGLVAIVTGFLGLSRNQYEYLGAAAFGIGLGAVTLGVHFLRTDATLLGAALLGLALAGVGMAGSVLWARWHD